MPGKRRPRGSGAIYRRSDGTWIGNIDLGIDGTGKRRRKTVAARSRPDVARRLDELKRQHRDGSVPSPAMTVAGWLDTWLATIARPRLKPKTHGDYESLVRLHLAPWIGAYKLAAFAPQHVLELHATLDSAGVGAATVHKVHRVLGAALTDALRHGHVQRNVTSLVDAPRKARRARTALTVAQAAHLLRTADAAGDPMVTRWAAALMLGARQGELLGLQWDRVNLDVGTIDLAWQLQALPQVHGCGDPPTCGKVRPGWCPSSRFNPPPGFELVPLAGTLALTRPKSMRSQRLIPMPAALVAMLDRHHRDPSRAAGELGLVWTTTAGLRGKRAGQPIHPRRDLEDWHAALERADLPSVALHAARNTTATLLLEAGVDAHVIQQILGHTEVATTRAYQTVDLELARRGMSNLDRLLES